MPSWLLAAEVARDLLYATVCEPHNVLEELPQLSACEQRALVV
jgi:hypothetical protein